jgi:hypothetical protein
MASPIILSILSVFKSQGLNQARQALLGASKDFNTLAGTIGKAAGAFSAFQALTSATQFTTQAVELTQRYERNLLALGQVFEQITPKMQAFTKEVENYGLSQSQAAQASVFLGSVLKQYGYSVDQSAAETQRLVKLAQDLAVTFGYDVQEALLAITALFRGEYDPIEKFGVAMKQAEVNARVAADGFGDLTGTEAANAQATARLTMLFERATDSIGAFERAGNTLYASQQLLLAATENLQVAFGAPLQEPIAAVLNSFAEVINEGDGIVEIGIAIGESFEAMGPTFGIFADLLVELLGPLQQVTELTTSFAKVALPPLNLVLGFLINALEDFNYALDFMSVVIGQANDEFEDFLTGPGADFLDWLNSAAEDSYIIQGISFLIGEIEKAHQAQRDFVDFARNNRTTESRRDMAMLSNATRVYGNEAKAVVEPVDAFIQKLKEMKIYTADAEGELTGLGGILMEIETTARKSKVAEALKEMGFQAGQIAYMLTKPDWETIFSQITRLAQIAALDIQKAVSISQAAMIFNAREELKKLLSSDLGSTSRDAGKKQAIDYVDAFTKALRESAQQRSARLQLELLGASAGLIDRILGADNWMKVWIAIKSGTLTVKGLQAAFNRTAEGAQETAERTAEIAERLKAVKAIAKETGSILERLIPQEDLPQFQADVKGVFDDLRSQINELLQDGEISPENASALGQWADAFQREAMRIAVQRDDIAKKIDETQQRIDKVKDFGFTSSDIEKLTKPISLIAEQVGEYEAQVIDSIETLREKIRQGAELELFDSRVVNNLSRLVDSTLVELTRIARARQAIAREMERMQDAIQFRTATREGIMAFADITNIATLAATNLQDVVRKSGRSTTEIVAQTIKAARNARDYRVILVKELGDAKDAAASSSDITANLRKLLEDTRAFASGLGQLKDLGLSPELISQISQAGTEIGLQLINAITAAGPEYVAELNSLYKQIGAATTQVAAEQIAIGLDKILSDTERFARNLDQLASMGLDTKVFEQIVAAGLEVGGRTAQAIVDGGPQVVDRINGLWSQIGATATLAANRATDTIFKLGGKTVEDLIAGLRARDEALSKEAETISKNMVGAIQKAIDDSKIDLTKVLDDLKGKRTALEEAGKILGQAFADKMKDLVTAALTGIKVEITGIDTFIAALRTKLDAVITDSRNVVITPPTAQPGAGTPPPPAAVFQEGGTGAFLENMNQNVDFLINSASDITRIAEYLNLRVIAANEFAADALRAGNRAASLSAQATAQDFLRTLKEVRDMQFTGTPTVVNINVKTDTTQSAAMVGKTIGRTVTKYVTTGGGVLVSPVG